MLDVVLVTGGSGLVGTCLLDAVEEQAESDWPISRRFIFLSSKSADLSNYQDAREIFKQYRPTHVVHLAAKVGGLYANMNDNGGAFYKVNKKINENVLALSYEFGVKRCMSCLSTCIFPDEIEYPLDETKIHEGPPHKSNAGYARAKRQVDKLNKKYNQLSNGKSSFFSIIPANIYGPNDNFDLHQGHVIPSLIHRAYLACMEHKKGGQAQSKDNQAGEGEREGDNLLSLKVCGSGKPLRQFIYAHDVAKLILWALDVFEVVPGGAEPPALILCPDEKDELSISQLAHLICSIFSEKYKIGMAPKFDTDHEDGQLRKTASNVKLRQMNESFEFTPLERGLKATIDWFCARYPHVRRGAGGRNKSNATLQYSSFEQSHTVEIEWWPVKRDS